MSITLNQIAEGIPLPIRRVRYVLEHRLLPRLEKYSQGHRITRSFTGFEGFGIACATVLLESGLRRAIVTEVMKMLLAAAKKPIQISEIPLMRAYISSGPLRLDVADGVNYRLAHAGLSATANEAWIQPATGAAMVKSYEPMAMNSVDLAPIRDAIRKIARE